ncbi:hypothetical protein BC835DRAFT_1357808 [Cytidiella melzeri]|nr:hypothetical protein BC835DRAFT_1374699 [Cytidiella melzeri]KAI0692343.1 hypothetical protein BC835DRAFT_1357808 [Cytidiella melzeri]
MQELARSNSSASDNSQVECHVGRPGKLPEDPDLPRLQASKAMAQPCDDACALGQASSATCTTQLDHVDTLVRSEVIYETSPPQRPEPSESYYRERLAHARRHDSTSSGAYDPSHSDPSTDKSYAARYLAGLVPYPSLPTVGLVASSGGSFVDVLGHSASHDFFPSMSIGDLRSAPALLPEVPPQ